MRSGKLSLGGGHWVRGVPAGKGRSWHEKGPHSPQTPHRDARKAGQLSGGKRLLPSPPDLAHPPATKLPGGGWVGGRTLSGQRQSGAVGPSAVSPPTQGHLGTQPGHRPGPVSLPRSGSWTAENQPDWVQTLRLLRRACAWGPITAARLGVRTSLPRLWNGTRKPHAEADTRLRTPRRQRGHAPTAQPAQGPAGRGPPPPDHGADRERDPTSAGPGLPGPGTQHGCSVSRRQVRACRSVPSCTRTSSSKGSLRGNRESGCPLREPHVTLGAGTCCLPCCSRGN